jgi:hypothetical protein
MAAENQVPAAPAGQDFVWHPEYKGKSVAAVRSSLALEIASDQRAYALTLDGAEEHEGDSLTSIIALERKWGPYDLNWAESDPNQLADRIVVFEQERERRQELIPYATFRDQVNPPDPAAYADPVAAQRLESPFARGLVVLLLLVIVLVAWFVFFR